jgi:hypothetical protein
VDALTFEEREEFYQAQGAVEGRKQNFNKTNLCKCTGAAVNLVL